MHSNPRVLRISRNREDAEDAAQDALLRAFLHLTGFDSRSSFATWLTRIATNSALMIVRKKRTSLEVALEYPDSCGPSWLPYERADGSLNPEKLYAQREREEILRGAIIQLRPKIPRVVELQQLQEHSLMRTAEMLAISVTAAKGRLRQTQQSVPGKGARHPSVRKTSAYLKNSKFVWGTTGRTIVPEQALWRPKTSASSAVNC
jgi:RNA polymerase sigma factor (sigma-70 family)